MDKLKAILATEETPYFSKTSGSKLLGEFAKRFPLANKHMGPAHVDDNTRFDTKISSKEELNDMFEQMGIFSEEMDPIIADFYVKVEELKAKSKLNNKLSATTWVSSRIIGLGFALGMMDFLDKTEDIGNKFAEMVSDLGSKERADEFRKIYTAQKFAELISRVLSGTASDMLEDIIGPVK